MIYFIQLPTGAVKIGYSDDVDRRLVELEVHYGDSLALLHVEPGGPDDEIQWHRRFAHARLGQTEQFQPVPELMMAIGRPLLVSPNPAEVEAVDPVRKVGIISLQGTPAEARWLDNAKQATLIPKAVIVRLALDLWGKQKGLPPYPDPGIRP